MRKIRVLFVLAAILLTQQVFASEGKSCATIADACLTAGFDRTETPGKNLWLNCMKPIILGQTISGVTVKPAVVQACRVHKIEELKKELKELQKSM